MAFDILAPFDDAGVLKTVMEGLARFEYKHYGTIPLKLYSGEPTPYEFDLNLGMVHFTEQDFKGLSAKFAEFNSKWGTRMTFCVYPAKESNRDMIMNIRGSPKAPSDLS